MADPNMTTAGSVIVALVGDSDIERWPQDLLPSHTHHVQGQSGATLAQTLALVAAALESTGRRSSLMLVFCAGENDISQGIRLDETLFSFHRLLEQVVPSVATTTSSTISTHLVVLGPKFEPWLNRDAPSRKQCVKLSQAIQRACQKHQEEIDHHHHRNNCHQPYDSRPLNTVTFVDCLTMFCGSSGQQAGALWGGKAMAQDQYFDPDQLHLSREGYAIWKQTVEQLLQNY